MYQSYLVLLVCGIACSTLGAVLVLRRLSMLTDAISHSVLLGIVLAFFISNSLDSPLLKIGAALFGIFTVYAVEKLGKTKYVKYDDAIGIIFPLFFSIAVILINRFARNAHIDIDIVLSGEVIFASLNTVDFLGVPLAKSFIRLGILAIINCSFLVLFFKEIKLSVFDNEYFIVSGFSSSLLFYTLMTLSSITTVEAFDAVGSILVVAMFISPAASAYFFTRSLKNMIFLSIIFSVLGVSIGFFTALTLNLSMSGSIAFFLMILFLLSLFISPDGIISRKLRRIKNKIKLDEDLFIVHLKNHTLEGNASIECNVCSMSRHLNWSSKKTFRVAHKLLRKDLIFIDNKCYKLTGKGDYKYAKLKEMYNLNI